MKSIIKSLVALSIVVVTCFHLNAQVSVGLSVRVGPPLLPVYTQPLCPADGYMWVPGYWAYNGQDYFWVPGAWVLPPQLGLLWTPGYWGLNGGSYGWNSGYWGSNVGFYGGINYGFGYNGLGYTGGMWRGNAFRYNTAVNNVNTTVIHNTYIDKTVIKNAPAANNRNSFNGAGGVVAKPTRQEQLAMKEQHVQRTSEQLSHEASARADRSQYASANHGHPARLAQGAISGKQVNNQQNRSVQTDNVKPRVYSEKINDDDNTDRNANSNFKGNVQNQDNQANTTQPEHVKDEQMNYKNEKRQAQVNQSPKRNEQMKLETHSPQSHFQNPEKNNNRERRER